MAKKPKTFVEALVEFQDAVMREYGPRADVVKVAVTPVVFDRLCYELRSQMSYDFEQIQFGLQDLSDGIQIRGIQILRRDKDSM